MEQADAFLAESEALARLIADVGEEAMDAPSGFKGWSINHIIRHLHVWNRAADLSLTDAPAFDVFLAKVMPGLAGGGGLRPFEESYLKGLKGKALVETWQDYFRPMAARFAQANPSARLKWAGPTMSVRSSITARLMETWAHGQAIHDMLGVVRENQDHIKNIVVLGVNTFGWTFKNRRLPVPEAMPFLELVAPSGEVWTFGEPSLDDHISGRAEEFCQVVTQTRNIADTSLVVEGQTATHWMAIAQCFAGPAEEPPAPGVRKTAN